MKRIAANRCGYNGYTCEPLGKLSPVFAHTDMIWDGIPQHVPVDPLELDNYKNIPARIEGFLMTLPNIPDMSGAPLEVPELSCRVDFDPMSDAPGAAKNDAALRGGFLDNYNVYDAAGTYVSAEVEGGTTTEYVLRNQMPDFEDTYILQPGLLEPMVDTSFDPVPIDQITAMEANNNGVLLSLGMLQNWRTEVDGHINNLYQKVRTTYGEYDAAGLIDALNQKYKKSPCANFTMTRTDGLNVTQVGSSNTPIYSIGGGIVYVDGTAVEVGAYDGTDSAGVFVAYLTVTKSSVSAVPTYTGTISVIRAPNNATPEELQVLPKIPANTDTTFNFQIGGVRLVPAPSNTESHGTKYQMYELVVDECLDNIELSGEGGGGSTVSWKYNGPFQVVAGATVGQVKVTGVDEDEDHHTQAGYICYNGTGCLLEPEHVVAIGSTNSNTGVDIWANIRGTTDVTFDTKRDTSSTPPAYNVRLARVAGYHTLYTVTLSGETSTYTPTGDTDIRKPGNPVYIIDTAYPGASIITGSSASDGTFWRVQATASGRIYGVTGGTFNGLYQTGGTASVKATNISDIHQFHFGDIYVDGRWS